MQRYSLSVSFIPRAEERGAYILYVTKTEWRDGECIKSEAIYEKKCLLVPERDECSEDLGFAAEMTDRAWNEIVAARSAERHQAKEEITPTGE